MLSMLWGFILANIYALVPTGLLIGLVSYIPVLYNKLYIRRLCKHDT